MSTKGSNSRVKDKAAYAQNFDAIFKKNAVKRNTKKGVKNATR